MPHRSSAEFKSLLLGGQFKTGIQLAVNHEQDARDTWQLASFH